MSFRALYNYRQTLSEQVKKTQVLKLAQEHSGKEALLQCTGVLDTEILRGLYLSFDDPRVRQLEYLNGRNLILFSRELNPCWSRLVIFKESMHLFDTPAESTSTADDFSGLLDEFAVRPPGKPSLEMRSEINAVWMALSLFLREEDRAELAQKRANGEVTDNEIAHHVRMPLLHVPNLFGPDYKDALEDILALD